MPVNLEIPLSSLFANSEGSLKALPPEIVSKVLSHTGSDQSPFNAAVHHLDEACDAFEAFLKDIAMSSEGGLWLPCLQADAMENIFFDTPGVRQTIEESGILLTDRLLEDAYVLLQRVLKVGISHAKLHELRWAAAVGPMPETIEESRLSIDGGIEVEDETPGLHYTTIMRVVYYKLDWMLDETGENCGDLKLSTEHRREARGNLGVLSRAWDGVHDWLH